MPYDRQVTQKAQQPVRPAPRPVAKRADGSSAGSVIGLQQTAGNAAVSQAVAAQKTQAATPAPAQAANVTPNPNVMAQFAALWEGMVVLPLARAYEKLNGPKPDVEVAMSEIDTALRTIGIVKAATPADDENRIRIEIVEIRATGLRDFLKEMRAKGGAKLDFSKQLIEWRAEAVSIGEELARGGAGDAADQGRRQFLAEYWQKEVVADLWTGQLRLSEEPDNPLSASTYLLGAIHSILLFMDHIPDDFPNPLRFIRLQRAIENVSDIVFARTQEKSPARIAEDAFELAVTVGKHLTGQPVEDEKEPGDEVQSAQPEFTWESVEKKPYVDDTALERP